MPVPDSLRGKLSELYSEVPSGGIGSCRCDVGLEINVCEGRMPRGIFGPSNVADVNLVVVGKNPGGPMEEEKESYCHALKNVSGTLAGSLMDVQATWCEYCHLNAKPYTYHGRLMCFLSKVFRTSNFKDILQRVYFTELVKCSTDDEQQNLNSKEFRRIAECCRDKWLKSEIDLLGRPLPILTLGHEAERYVRRMGPEICNRVIYYPHPSYYPSKLHGRKAARVAFHKIQKFLNEGVIESDQKCMHIRYDYTRQSS